MFVNDITFAGNLGSDAQDRSTAGGTRVVSFSLCYNEKGKSGRQDVSTWVRVKVFGAWCETAAKFVKGDNVLVKGKLEVSKYESNGKTFTNVDIIPFALSKLETERRASQASQSSNTNQNSWDGFNPDEEPLPF